MNKGSFGRRRVMKFNYVVLCSPSKIVACLIGQLFLGKSPGALTSTTEPTFLRHMDSAVHAWFLKGLLPPVFALLQCLPFQPLQEFLEAGEGVFEVRLPYHLSSEPRPRLRVSPQLPQSSPPLPARLSSIHRLIEFLYSFFLLVLGCSPSYAGAGRGVKEHLLCISHRHYKCLCGQATDSYSCSTAPPPSANTLSATAAARCRPAVCRWRASSAATPRTACRRCPTRSSPTR